MAISLKRPSLFSQTSKSLTFIFTRTFNYSSPLCIRQPFNPLLATLPPCPLQDPQPFSMLPFSGPVFPRTAPIFSQKGQVQLYDYLWPVSIPTHVDLPMPDIYYTNVYHFLQLFCPPSSPPILALSQRAYPHLLSQKGEINL